MDDTPEFELHTERWCAGLRFADARPFEPAERALLQGRIQALTRKFWTAVACVPVSIVVPLTSAYLLPRNLGTAWLGAVAMLIAIAIACAAPALFVLRAAAARRNRNAHRHDLEAGEMLRFEGTLEGRSALDEEQKQLLDVGVLAPRPGDPQTLEVLRSGERRGG